MLIGARLDCVVVVGVITQVTARLKQEFPAVLIEASGGITAETMHEYMGDAVDIISRGSLTQDYACLDFSLKIMPTQP